MEPYAALWRIRADGSDATELLNAGRPSTGGFLVAGWSPNGAQVLYWPQPMLSASLLADGIPLMAVSAAGGTPRGSTAGMLAYQDFIAWAPDGQLPALVEGTSRATWENTSIAVGAPGSLQRRSDAGALTSSQPGHRMASGSPTRAALLSRRPVVARQRSAPWSSGVAGSWPLTDRVSGCCETIPRTVMSGRSGRVIAAISCLCACRVIEHSSGR